MRQNLTMIIQLRYFPGILRIRYGEVAGVDLFRSFEPALGLIHFVNWVNSVMGYYNLRTYIPRGSRHECKVRRRIMEMSLNRNCNQFGCRYAEYQKMSLRIALHTNSRPYASLEWEMKCNPCGSIGTITGCQEYWLIMIGDYISLHYFTFLNFIMCSYFFHLSPILPCLIPLHLVLLLIFVSSLFILCKYPFLRNQVPYLSTARTYRTVLLKVYRKLALLNTYISMYHLMRFPLTFSRAELNMGHNNLLL